MTSQWKYTPGRGWWGVLGFVGGVWRDENCEWEIQICVTLGVLINNFLITT